MVARALFEHLPAANYRVNVRHLGAHYHSNKRRARNLDRMNDCFGALDKRAANQGNDRLWHKATGRCCTARGSNRQSRHSRCAPRHHSRSCLRTSPTTPRTRQGRCCLERGSRRKNRAGIQNLCRLSGTIGPTLCGCAGRRRFDDLTILGAIAEKSINTS